MLTKIIKATYKRCTYLQRNKNNSFQKPYLASPTTHGVHFPPSRNLSSSLDLLPNHPNGAICTSHPQRQTLRVRTRPTVVWQWPQSVVRSSLDQQELVEISLPLFVRRVQQLRQQQLWSLASHERRSRPAQTWLRDSPPQ